MAEEKQSQIAEIFEEIGRQIVEEEKLRLDIKAEVDVVIDELREMVPKSQAEKLLQIETFMIGMTQGLKNLRDYNDRQKFILEDFRKLLEGTSIQ